MNDVADGFFDAGDGAEEEEAWEVLVCLVYGIGEVR